MTTPNEMEGAETNVKYHDDGCFIGPDAKEIENIIKSMQKDYDMTDEGDLVSTVEIRRVI